jgi:hypothetical protein
MTVRVEVAIETLEADRHATPLQAGPAGGIQRVFHDAGHLLHAPAWEKERSARPPFPCGEEHRGQIVAQQLRWNGCHDAAGVRRHEICYDPERATREIEMRDCSHRARA